MSTLWPTETRQAQGFSQMPSLPSKYDIEETWHYLETGINCIMFESSCGIGTQMLVGMYTAVFNHCTSQTAGTHSGAAHILGGEIYERLINWLRSFLVELKERADSHTSDVLIRFYIDELAHYTKAARYIHHIFRYLNRHWVKRQNDEGQRNVYEIYELHLVQWRDELEKLSHNVMQTLSELEKHQDGTTGQKQIESVVDSLDKLELESQSSLKINHVADSTPIAPSDEISQLREELRQTLISLSDTNVQPRLSSGPSHATTIVKLATSDGAIVEVERQVAEVSTIIKLVLEEIGDQVASEEVIPLPNVDEGTLRKVLQWCEHHKDDYKKVDLQINSRWRTNDIDEWDAKFMETDQDMVFEIILAANYLEIEPLVSTGCQIIANMIKGKSPEQIRDTFNITNDFTPEEEEQIRREREWAED